MPGESDNFSSLVQSMGGQPKNEGGLLGQKPDLSNVSSQEIGRRALNQVLKEKTVPGPQKKPQDGNV